MKNFISLLATLTLAIHLTACTSNDKAGEGDEVLDETAAVDQELESMDGEAAPTGEVAADDQLPEDALGETENNSTEVAAGDESAQVDGETPPEPEIAAEDSTATGDSSVPDGFSAPPPVDENASGFVDSGAEAPPADVAATSEPEAPVVETPAEPTPAPSEPVAAVEPAAPKPLLKVESAPFRRDGILLNAVYIARPGDTYKSIATAVYGSADKASELKKANSWVSKPKPGTKIYYNSPQRPTDDQRLLTYYEDNGVAPEMYQAQPGENLRTVAKTLLGYDKAWQEVWATNSIDSKSDITEPTTLRYWKGSAVAAPPSAPSSDVAANMPPPDSGMPTELPPPADMPPPPSDLPPPSDVSTGSMAANDLPPPADMPPPPPPDLPPPPPAEAINPPPPPPPVAVKSSPEEEGGGAMDQDMMMIAGIGVVLLALVGLIVARKKRQQRDMAAAFNDTQVGT